MTFVILIGLAGLSTFIIGCGVARLALYNKVSKIVNELGTMDDDDFDELYPGVSWILEELSLMEELQND